MNPSATPAPKPPLPARLLRSTLVVLLVLAFTLIAALFFAGMTFSLVDTYFKDAEKPPGGEIATLGAIVTLFPLALALVAARRRWLTWPVLVVGSVIAGGVLAWLAWDDPVIRRPLTIEEVTPVFEGDDRSYAVLMEYDQQNPGADAQVFAVRKQAPFKSRGPGDGDRWIEFITANRADLEVDWTAAASERAWLERLNAFDHFGDFTPPALTGNIPDFSVWRFLAERTAAIASLQALDGRPDEAVATLLPMLQASWKLERSSRTLLRAIIARMCQKLCYQTAGFILDRGNPGPAARVRLIAALEGDNGRAGVRRILLAEYALVRPTLSKITLTQAAGTVDWGAPLPRAFNLLTRFVFNPRATINLYGDHVHQLAALAEARDHDAFAAKQEAFAHSLYRNGGMKNLGGRLAVHMAVPAYQKIVKTYWDVEDLRFATLARLPGP